MREFWNGLMRHESRAWSALVAYAGVPLLVALCVVSRAFHADGILPIDPGDEAAETFVQVPMAHTELARGDILKINLFNNFGTPMLGDPVGYPYALHAWTYVLFRPVIAMLVNKLFLAALTMVVLTAFHARYFSPLISSACAFLSFSSPAFFYFFENHPHQGALLYFGLVLLAGRRFLDEPGAARARWLYAAFLAFYLSVGINGALLGTGFLGAYLGLMAMRRWRSLGIIAALWVAALIAVHPQLFEFFAMAAKSARKDLNYQQITSVSAFELIKGLFVRDSRISQAEVYYSIPVVGLIVAGLVVAIVRWRRSEVNDGAGSESPSGPRSLNKLLKQFISCLGITGTPLKRGVNETAGGSPALPKRGVNETSEPAPLYAPLKRGANEISGSGSELRRLMIILGVVPFTVVMFCRIFPQVAAALPLVKAINISRILWFSDIFLLLAAGQAAQALRELCARRGSALRVAGATVVLGTVVTRYPMFHYQANMFFATEPMTGIQVPRILREAEPQTRLTTMCELFNADPDFTGNPHGILGSNGRSIILSKALRDNLLQRGLVQLGFNGMTYAFRPARPEVLARSGIRYAIVCAAENEMEAWGWERRFTMFDSRGTFLFHFYASPLQVTPVYTQGSQIEFIQKYRVSGNEVEAQLPATGPAMDVIATFLVLPGWKAYLDGKRVPIEETEDHFIRVHAPEQLTGVPIGIPRPDATRRLLLRYEPYSNGWIIGSGLVSVAGAMVIAWILKRLLSKENPMGDEV
jgi:hypothetical protein